MLTGKIICGECGSNYTGINRKARPDHPQYITYRCSKKHGESQFGKTLYEKYMKVVANKDIMERVENMQLYQEKIQLQYHTVDEADNIWEKGKEESREEIAINAIKKGLSLDLIKELTGFNMNKLKALKRRYESGQ